MFLGESGTGKSTHTRLWKENIEGATLLNDDSPFLRIVEGKAIVYGSPWSGKHGLDSNVRVPLKGICILERGTENKIQAICGEDALPMLRKQAYMPLDNGKLPRFLALTQMLSEATPLWRMACTKNPDAARIAYETMNK